MNVQVGGKTFVEAVRGAIPATVAEMVEAWFATEASLENESSWTSAKLERVLRALCALEDSILRTPSKTQKDFVAKLRLALSITVHKAGYWGHETKLLATVAYECAHMCDRDNEAERDAAEKAGSYEGYLALIGMPMPERTAAESAALTKGPIEKKPTSLFDRGRRVVVVVEDDNECAEIVGTVRDYKMVAEWPRYVIDLEDSHGATLEVDSCCVYPAKDAA